MWREANWPSYLYLTSKRKLQRAQTYPWNSGSQTGVRGPFGVRKTIFWDREAHSKNQNDAPKEKFLYKIKFSGK